MPRPGSGICPLLTTPPLVTAPGTSRHHGSGPAAAAGSQWLTRKPVANLQILGYQLRVMYHSVPGPAQRRSVRHSDRASEAQWRHWHQFKLTSGFVDHATRCRDLILQGPSAPGQGHGAFDPFEPSASKPKLRQTLMTSAISRPTLRNGTHLFGISSLNGSGLENVAAIQFLDSIKAQLYLIANRNEPKSAPGM